MGHSRAAFAAPPAAPAVLTPGWLGSRYRPVLLAALCGLVALGSAAIAPGKPKEAVALLLGSALVAVVLLWPLVGAVVLATLVPISSGLVSGFPVAHVRLSEAAIGVVGITLIAFARREVAVPWKTLDWALLAYGLCWAAFGVYGQLRLGQHLTLDEWGTVFGQLQFFLVYRGIRMAVRTPDERRIVLGWLLLASAPVAVLALLQKAGAPGVEHFIVKITGGLTGGSGATGAASVSRVTGPFVNWAALAGYLLPVLLVLAAMAFAHAGVRRRWVFVATGVLAALALALTVEQSAIVCLVVGLFVLARRYDEDGRVSRWLVIGVVAVGVAASPVLVARLVHELSGSAGTGRIWWVPQTVSFRWSVWTRQYLPAIGARPLTGYGVVLPSTVHWQFPESQYVSFLMEGGVPMLVAFAVLAWAMLDGALSASRSADPLARALGLSVAVAVVSMLVMDTMWPFLSNGGMPQVLWVLLALTVPGGLVAGRGRSAHWPGLVEVPGQPAGPRVRAWT
jgi:hypothetical protein